MRKQKSLKSPKSVEKITPWRLSDNLGSAQAKSVWICANLCALFRTFLRWILMIRDPIFVLFRFFGPFRNNFHRIFVFRKTTKTSKSTKTFFSTDFMDLTDHHWRAQAKVLKVPKVRREINSLATRGQFRECASKICVDLCESVCPYSDIHPLNPHDPWSNFRPFSYFRYVEKFAAKIRNFIQ